MSDSHGTPLVGDVVAVIGQRDVRGLVISQRGEWHDVFIFGSGNAPPVAYMTEHLRVVSTLDPRPGERATGGTNPKH